MAAAKQYNAPFDPAIVNVRCPSCRKLGAFHGIEHISDASFFELSFKSGRHAGTPFIYGVRICPNPECAEPLFVVLGEGYKLRQAYPAECLDFEPEGVPAPILASFQEAIKSHSNACFRAAAIMVRRTLEEICRDRGASGKNLQERIIALGAKILVPKELLEAADELRLLGNDAAHLEAKVYDDVGKEEVEVAIDLAKEVLKAVYQLSGLVDRLRALKRP